MDPDLRPAHTPVIRANAQDNYEKQPDWKLLVIIVICVLAFTLLLVLGIFVRGRLNARKAKAAAKDVELANVKPQVAQKQPRTFRTVTS
jgi:flagellar basal body-associated protein FliL